ncbi:MAG: hypothetical protein ACRC10_11220 [Thermoguttaceae bacterium]
MSLIDLKKLLGSIFLLLILSSVTFAQNGFRPWAPYERDQFGGGPRQKDGMYGTLEGIFYTFAPLKNLTVGATDETGKSMERQVYWGQQSSTQKNSIEMNQSDGITGMSTRAEIGYRRGHHGWYFGGFELSGLESNLSMSNASVVINDPMNIETKATTNPLYSSYVREGGSIFRPVQPGEVIQNVGQLWGWFPKFEGEGDLLTAELAPLPITFQQTTTTLRMDFWNIEGMYTYRLHPTVLGGLELGAGCRYVEANDSMNFSGLGNIWGTLVGADADTIGVTGMGSVLSDSNWTFSAENHIVAPQFGGRYTRQNGRWSLYCEGKFLAGMNIQNLVSKGNYGTNWTGKEIIEFDGEGGYAMTTWIPLPYTEGYYAYAPLGVIGSGPASGNRSFYHRETRTVFSPGIEFKMGANWQMTNALGFQVGFNLMWIDNIARGMYINDYTIQPDGTFFGIKEKNYMDSMLMYGVSFGVTLNRF